jgi:hypothetical protein
VLSAFWPQHFGATPALVLLLLQLLLLNEPVHARADCNARKASKMHIDVGQVHNTFLHII